MTEHTACGLCRIELSGLSVTRGGKSLLSGVSMHVHCGQLTALIGHNGAGKTTLMRALLGQTPYTGTVTHLDVEGRSIPHVRIGYVPQQLRFDESMPISVSDFMAAALTRRPVWTGIGRRGMLQVMQALEKADAGGLASRPMGRLSGGELQRVLLALALTPAPDLLLLDEPVSGVDQNGQMLFLDKVLELRREHHMAILLISHDFSLVSRYADHVVLLDKRVLCQGKPEEVFASEQFAAEFPMPGQLRAGEAAV